MSSNDEAKVFSSVDDLFAASIDDLADLPAFEVPPAGAYILRVTCSPKVINEKPAVEAAFEVIETVELSDAKDNPAAPGTKFSMAFMVQNEFGVGKLKQFLAPFQEHFQQGNIGALIAEIKDIQIAATLKVRKDKEDPDKKYANVTNITVA